jgi:hypothetical protein
MALAAVKGVYSMGSLAVGILRLFSLDFPSASLCDCVISTVREGCPYKDCLDVDECRLVHC